MPMLLRHVVLLKLKDDLDKASAATELAAAARLVPSASARASYQELA